jgi:phenylacetate-CoA ligase
MEQMRVYLDYRPCLLTGYASALQQLGETLQKNGNPFPKPKMIMPVGEMLTANTRRSLQETFQAPVRDLYGTEEFGYLAWECSRGGGYHLNTDCFFFEVLQDGRPVPAGAEGELVVTSLYMKTMPLIRYRPGDRVVLDPEPCACGCGFPRLKSIQGRLDDFLILPNGEKVHAVLAVNAFKSFSEVRRFQVIQEEDGRIRINLAAHPFLNQEQIQGLRRYFQTHFQTASVGIHQAHEIPIDPAVKWKPVVCRKRS